jgi:N6-adenosine-specific RNA methylase IME4
VSAELVPTTGNVALALPDPQRVAVAEVYSRVIPQARAWRDHARETADMGAARELAARLDAFGHYLKDRAAKAAIEGESRRTEVLIGQLLGPGVVGPHDSPASASAPVPRADRHRFRTLAEHANRVEQLLSEGVVKRRQILDRITRPTDTPQPEPTPGTYRTIVADPPWRYSNAATRAAAADHYHTLSVEQLVGLEPMPDGTKLPDDVQGWAADDAHLYLWTTAAFLRDAFQVMDAWGFEYKTYLAWVKPQIGMGNYFRISSELILFGVRGRLPITDRGISNWFESRRGKHSAKPEKFYDLVGRASPGPHLEMFSRCHADTHLPDLCRCSKCMRGWHVWGNEA